MSDLWSIVQAHLDTWGVREAEVARRMGSSPQTLNSWKNRGVRKLPQPRLLAALADVTGTPYMSVLFAALHDTGYLPEAAVRATTRTEQSNDEAPISQAAGSAAPEVTVADEEGVPLQSPRQRAAGDDSPPRRESPDRGRRG